MQDSTIFKWLAFGAALSVLSACVGTSFETVNFPAAKNLFDTIKTVPETVKWPQ